MSPTTIVRKYPYLFGFSALVLGALLVVVPAAAVAPFGRYDLTDELVTDLKTRLVWQRRAPATTRKWTDCLAYCENLDLAGSVDWRLPNAREYVTIIDHTADPAWDATAFGGEPSGSSYYTSSVVQQANRSVSFNRLGSFEENNNTSPRYCRCVRGPDPEPAPN